MPTPNTIAETMNKAHSHGGGAESTSHSSRADRPTSFSLDGIPVPAHIQFRGYDLPQYVNVQYPWDGHEQIDPGGVPQDYNPVASYVRGFTLPGAPPDGERIVFRANRHEFGARGAS